MSTGADTATAGVRKGFSPRSLYRTLSIAEAITWTLLILGLLAKYLVLVGPTGDLVLRISGTIHGFVFLSYGATAILVGINQRWNPLLAVGAVATAIVPYATIPFDHWLERKNKLDGSWRVTKTDDPRDANWFDGLVRWMLNRPYLLAFLIAMAIVVLFAVLLFVGPPGGSK
jgi:integral membrane protein